jgi:integrase
MGKKNSERQQSRIKDFWLSKRPNSDAWCITWFDPRTRQTRRASTGEVGLLEAELKLAEHVASHARMDRQPATRTPLETVLVRYFKQHAIHLKSAEQARYALRRWSDFFAGALVSEVTADRQRAFVAAMRAEKLSDGYIRRVLACGQAAINRAFREGEIASAPQILLRLAPEGEPRERVLTIEETARLFAAADTPHLRAFLIAAFATGARPSSVLELTTFQCDLAARLVRLNPPGRAQNKKRRPTLPMVDQLYELVARTPAGPLVSFNGKHIRDIGKGFAKACAAAGLDKDVTPYVIRHTVATEMSKRGVQIWEVAAWLGHSTGYRTTERYAKVSPEHLAGCVRALNSYFADLRLMLGGLSSGPLHNPVRANGVLAGLSLVTKDETKSFVYLVEPRGIEPRTSTMPL